MTLRVTDDRLEIQYIYEMLEIAAINTARAWDSDGDGRTSDAERDAYAAALGAELSRHLRVRLDDREVPLTLESVRWELGKGAMGLATWKLFARLSGQLPVGAPTGQLEYRDELRPDEAGWKEVRLIAGGATGRARSGVPAYDRSAELTDYGAMSNVPNPNETSASALLRFSGAVVPPVARAPKGEPGQAAERIPRQGQASARPHRAKPGPGKPNTTFSSAAPAASGEAPATALLPSRALAASSPNPAASSFAATLRDYAWPFFKLGVYHIATGFDHLLFLLGLLLLRQSLGRLAAVVTAFTVAHSITLALAAARWVTPPGGVVELVIAASIAYVGAVALVRQHTAHGWLIALGFGLAHGFGFAGALSQALGDVGSGDSWLVALASFNLGIEAFQLLVVVAAWPLLKSLDRYEWSAGLRKLLSFIVLSAGLGWVAVRAAALGG